MVWREDLLSQVQYDLPTLKVILICLYSSRVPLEVTSLATVGWGGLDLIRLELSACLDGNKNPLSSRDSSCILVILTAKLEGQEIFKNQVWKVRAH